MQSENSGKIIVFEDPIPKVIDLHWISNLKKLLKLWRKTQNELIAYERLIIWCSANTGPALCNPATFGFVLLDSLECDHIKLESGCVKSVEVENKDNHGAGYESDKFAQNWCWMYKKSDTGEKRKRLVNWVELIFLWGWRVKTLLLQPLSIIRSSQTTLNRIHIRFFSTISQHGPSPKGKEEPWCREAIERGQLSGEANCRGSSKAIVPKSYGNFMVSKKSYLKKDSDL